MELDTSGITKELYCIKYPGRVVNLDNMMATLGGMSEISKVMGIKNRRMELRMRPKDVYCKPIYGDKIRTNSLLLRIKVSIVKNKESGETSACGSVHIVGRVTTTVVFKSLGDFQFLPMDITGGKLTDLSGKLLPQTINGTGLTDWLNCEIPQHLPPPVFSKIDSINSNSYMFRNIGDKSVPDNKILFRTRKKRTINAHILNFDDNPVPDQPKEKALKYLQVKILDKPLLVVKQKFEERPVWSKLALRCVTGLKHNDLTFILPCAAYYFVTGPFRRMWVRLGYDPRKDPESRIYQSLGYRMKYLASLSAPLRPRKVNPIHGLPTKKTQGGKRPNNIAMSQKVLDEMNQLNIEANENKEPQLKGDEYIFTTDTIPNTKQLFYQYIDLKLPEVEALFERLPKDPPEGTDLVCDYKNGFLPNGFDVHCRNVITDYLNKSIHKTKEVLPLPNEEMGTVEHVGGDEEDDDEDVSGGDDEDEEDEEEVMEEGNDDEEEDIDE